MSTQLTSITAAHLKMGGRPIAHGSVLFTLIAKGGPVAVSAGGEQHGPVAFAGQVLAGVLSGLSVPDLGHVVPLIPNASASYSIRVVDLDAKVSYDLTGVSNVTGDTWSLDDYAPNSVVPVTAADFSSGSGEPLPHPGNAPAIYLRTDTQQLYACFNGVWLAGSGSAGSQGPKGDKGDTGPAGPAGATGPAGPQGAQGATGAKGDTGPQGLTGATGAVGPQGLTGATGAKGDTGSTGAAGPSGVVSAAAPLSYNAGTQSLSINLAAPGPIGGTTPAAISGTTGTFSGRLATSGYFSAAGTVPATNASQAYLDVNVGTSTEARLWGTSSTASSYPLFTFLQSSSNASLINTPLLIASDLSIRFACGPYAGSNSAANAKAVIDSNGNLSANNAKPLSFASVNLPGATISPGSTNGTTVSVPGAMVGSVFDVSHADGSDLTWSGRIQTQARCTTAGTVIVEQVANAALTANTTTSTKTINVRGQN